MKIMLVNPDLKTKQYKFIASRISALPPPNIAYLAAVLKTKGFKVIIIDQVAEEMSNRRLLERIKEASPQLIGFSCLFPVMSNVKMIVDEIKSFDHNVRIVLGNILPTLFAEEILKRTKADIVIRGEGELTMLDLALAIKSERSLRNIEGISFINDGRIYHNPERELIEDLDILPYPAWELFDLNNYKETFMAGMYGSRILPIVASRGCPYHCKYCSQDKVFKKPRYRKFESVVDELEYLCEEYKSKCFYFVDPYFPFSIDYGYKFCEEITRRQLHSKIKWCVQMRVDLANLELLKKMKKAGCYLIMYGFEVGSRKILDVLNKGTTLEQAKKIVKHSRQAGIFSVGFFILGLPGETKQTCEETIKFAKRLDCDEAIFHIFIPYPGSDFFKFYESKFDITINTEKFVMGSVDRVDLPYVPKDISSNGLMNLQRKAYFSFYLRPKVIAKYITQKIIPFKILFLAFLELIKAYLRSIIGNFRINSI